MTKWDLTALEEVFDEFAPRADPDDPKERKRLRLIEAATDLFVKQGYRKTSIEEVARHAGVGKGTVYLYFKTKGELLMHAVIEEKRRHFEQLTAFLHDGATPAERLKHYIRTVLLIGREMPLVSRIMQGDRALLAALADMPTAAMAKSQAFRVDFLGELIAEAAGDHGWEAEALAERAQVLGGLLHIGALIEDENVRGAISVERFATVMATMIVDGLGPKTGGS